MAFSGLQRYILVQAFSSPQRSLSRGVIARYYERRSRRPKARDIPSIVSRSLERLIARQLLVGYGRQTAKKWFIERVRLTPRGRGVAWKLLGVQQALPLKLKRKNEKVKTIR